MGHFYGGVEGNRGSATQMGTKSSGLHAYAQGWDIGADLHVGHDKTTGKDVVYITVNAGSNARQSSIAIGRFTEGNIKEQIQQKEAHIANFFVVQFLEFWSACTFEKWCEVWMPGRAESYQLEKFTKFRDAPLDYFSYLDAINRPKFIRLILFGEANTSEE